MIEDLRRNERKLCRVNARQNQELAGEPVLPCHQFGARMISWCVNLARVIGLRPAVACLQVVFE